MKTKLLVMAFTQIFLVACGSGNNLQNDLSQKASDNSIKGTTDPSGCNSSTSPFGGGNGRDNNPYLICSAAQLGSMAQSFSPSYFALTADLDMTNERHLYLGTAVVGSFDGRGHTIRNFNAHLEMDQEGGYLFGQLFTTNEIMAEIKNLNLDNFQIRTNSIFGTAALVGSNSGKITNVHVTGNISGQDLVGGIVANNFGTILDSSFSGSIQGKQIIGGITGRSTGHLIKNCQVSGQVSGESLVGGIFGEADKKSDLMENRVVVSCMDL